MTEFLMSQVGGDPLTEAQQGVLDAVKAVMKENDMELIISEFAPLGSKEVGIMSFDIDASDFGNFLGQLLTGGKRVDNEQEEEDDEPQESNI